MVVHDLENRNLKYLKLIGFHDCEDNRSLFYFDSAAVNFICDNPDIRAVSFVGSDQAGIYIHERASQNGKRVQCNMGAKNHGVIMPDANKTNTLNQVSNRQRLC